jgi:hypothetical protein
MTILAVSMNDMYRTAFCKEYSRPAASAAKASEAHQLS